MILVEIVIGCMKIVFTFRH